MSQCRGVSKRGNEKVEWGSEGLAYCYIMFKMQK